MHSDFWWLPGCTDECMVGVAHQKPLGYEDEPRSVSWHYWPDKCEPFRPDPPQIKVASIDEWRARWQSTNVYRTLVVSRPDGTRLLGPFVVDIDSDYGQDLDHALVVTRKALDYLLTDRRVASNDVRIFFSGQKGFNIEVRPAALGLSAQQFESALDDWRRTLDDVVRWLGGGGPQGNQVSSGGTFIDKIYGSRLGPAHLKHPYLRLHDSINSWMAEDGKQLSRMKMEVTREELGGPAAAMVKRSESLREGRT